MNLNSLLLLIIHLGYFVNTLIIVNKETNDEIYINSNNEELVATSSSTSSPTRFTHYLIRNDKNSPNSKKHRILHRNTNRNSKLNTKKSQIDDYQQQQQQQENIDNSLIKPVQAINLTAKVGETVVLNCVINSSYGLNPGVIWMQGKLGNVLTLNTNRITVDPRFDIIQQALAAQLAPTHGDENLDLISNNKEIITKQQNDVSYYNLQIENIQLYDENEYACETSITKRNEDQPNLHSLVYLHVTQSPSFIESLTSESNLAGLEFGEIILKCFASGKPTPRIRWYQIDENTGSIKDLNHESTSLSIRNLSKHDNSKYECVASNGIIPSVSKKFTLTVYYSPIVSQIQPSTNQYSGQTVVLGCIVSSNPESTIEWYKLENRTKSTDISMDIDHTRIEQSDLKYHIHKIKQINQTISYLKIRNVDKSDFSKYKCEAQNAIGKSEIFIELLEFHEQNNNQKIKNFNRNKLKSNVDSENENDLAVSLNSDDDQYDSYNILNENNQNENEYSIKQRPQTENSKDSNFNSKKIASLSANSKHNFYNSHNRTIYKHHINKSNRIIENENSLKRINDIVENKASNQVFISFSSSKSTFILLFIYIFTIFIQFSC